MQKRSKRILAATLAAVGVAVASGVAYAVWAYSPVASATGTSETFAPVTVSGTWQGRDLVAPNDSGLMPTESGIVTLDFTVPSNNTVNARIASITASNIGDLDISPDDRDFCKDYLIEGTYVAPGTILPAGKPTRLVLNRAVGLQSNAPVDCQGMTFSTSWTVTFEATRDPITSGLDTPAVISLTATNVLL